MKRAGLFVLGLIGMGLVSCSSNEKPSASDRNVCSQPLAVDAGFATYDEALATLCAEAEPHTIRWNGSCAGSIVLLHATGVDCDDYFLFDATTKTLQATARGCIAGPGCTGSVPGFRLPGQCFDGTAGFPTGVTNECAGAPADAGADTGD